MNVCPHCGARANPLRLAWKRLYVCSGCDGRSVHDGRVVGVLNYLSLLATLFGMVGLFRWLGWSGDSFAGHPARLLGALACAFALFLFWQMLIRCLTGSLIALPKLTAHDSDPESSALRVPPHPGHDRKEITTFLVIVAVTAAATYGLSRSPRFEMAALAVLVLVPLLGVAAIHLFRKIRCPDCGTAMELVRTTRIDDREWEIYRCPQSHGEWRVRKPVRPPP